MRACDDTAVAITRLRNDTRQELPRLRSESTDANSRVRALTENANTGNARADRQSNGRKDTEHYGVETIGVRIRANVFERGGALKQLVDRHIR